MVESGEQVYTLDASHVALCMEDEDNHGNGRDQQGCEASRLECNDNGDSSATRPASGPSSSSSGPARQASSSSVAAADTTTSQWLTRRVRRQVKQLHQRVRRQRRRRLYVGCPCRTRTHATQLNRQWALERRDLRWTLHRAARDRQRRTSQMKTRET